MPKDEAGDPYKTNVAKVRKRLKETEGDKRWWKPKYPGLYFIRVLPPWGPAAEGEFFLTGGLHYNFKIGGKRAAVPCWKTAFPPQRCLICEFIEALRARGSDEDEELIRGKGGIRIKRKYWVNLVDRKTPGQIMMYGGSRKFIDTIKDALNDDDYGDITDPEDGHDIKVKREGTGFSDTEYTFTVRPKASPLGIPDWKKKVFQLDKEVIEWIPLAQTAKILRANYEDEMEELGFKIKMSKEDQEVSKKRKVEEEDIESQEDDDEDEEVPKKKTKKLIEEEEDEDTEEEDENEDDSEGEEEDED